MGISDHGPLALIAFPGRSQNDQDLRDTIHNELRLRATLLVPYRLTNITSCDLNGAILLYLFMATPSSSRAVAP